MFRTEVLRVQLVETVRTPELEDGLGLATAGRTVGMEPPTDVTVVVIAPDPAIVRVHATAAVAPAAAVAIAADRSGLRCAGGADGATI